MTFAESEIFDAPPDDVRIWRYMSFANFVWLIGGESLHFHKVHRFEDPFEGSVPRAYYELRKRGAQQMEEDEEGISAEKYIRVMEDAAPHTKRLICANCWHYNGNESAAMWDKYDDRAIAMVTNAGNLKDALERTDRQVHLHRMIYMDYDAGMEELSPEYRVILDHIVETTDGPHMYIPYMMKREEYSHENEIRALLHYGDDWTDEGWDPGENVGVHLDSLLDEIIVSPFAQDWLLEAAEYVVEESDCEIGEDSVSESYLDSETYDLMR